MGSCLSLRKVRETKVPIALVQIPRRKIVRNSKSYRSFCSSSSGFSSTNISPSKSSECASNEEMKSFNIKRKNVRRILKRIPMCDDYDEHKAFMQKYWQRNRSSGYYSASSPEPPQTRDVGTNYPESSITKSHTVTSDVSTNASTMQNAASVRQIGKTSTPFAIRRNVDGFCATTQYAKWMKYLLPDNHSDPSLELSNVDKVSNQVDRNISEGNLSQLPAVGDDFGMEVFMMQRTGRLIGKISTPLPSRHIIEEPCTTRYAKWINDLLDTPDYMFAKYFKLERLLSTETTPEVSEEWGSGWTGTNFIVEIEETETASSINTDYYSSHEYVTETTNATNMTAQGPKIIVRTEEVLIVGLVLMLWVGAIILFFNRWGKIRMLEPYQPKFQQQHRASCLADTLESIPTHQRSSVTRTSMGLVNNINMPACQFAMCKPALYSKGFPGYVRPRQNSVFVGPSSNRFFMPKPPRKTRSAMDLHSMVLDESAEAV